MNTPSLPSFPTPYLPLTRLFSAILFLVSFRFVLFTIHFISNTFTPASIRTDPTLEYINIYLHHNKNNNNNKSTRPDPL